MGRVTQKQLEAYIEGINELTNSPLTKWREENGRQVANVGHFCLDCAYGGYQFVRVSNEGAAVEEISYGYVSPKELLNYLQAFKKALLMVSAKDNYKKVQI